MTAPIGVYIHIPFCLRKCPYCDFYSLAYDTQTADAYTGALVRAIETQPYGSLRADTVYFGGGTPALLGPARLETILACAAKAFSVPADAEITLETNPAATTREDLLQLRKAGFNRLSVGVQSLADSELAALGRLHSAQQARGAVLDAAGAGFAAISADLMLAVPGQTRESLARSVALLSGLPVNHISAYLLKLEEGTPFYAQKSALALMDDDAAANLYLDCVRQLSRQGFTQYEISNFARGEHASRHNLKYWRCEPYLGIGPAAHSFLGGKRFFFPRDLAAFLAAGRPFELAVSDGDGGSPEERLLLRLRLREGIAPADHLPPESAGRLLQKASQLAAHGLATVENGRVALTPRGFLLSNPVIAALLAAAESACE